MTASIRTITLRFDLRSAATFGRGSGLPGEVDQEVEHDRYGLPYLRGRALRGLLAEEARSIIFALGKERGERWLASCLRLFGEPGQMMDDPRYGILSVSDARLPERLRRLMNYAVEQDQLTADDSLNSMTAIRRQTAMTHRGAPETASLRAMRVILRGMRFEAQLSFSREPAPLDLALLVAATLAWRRVGTGRNRGRGRVRAWLEDEEWTRKQFEVFQREVVER